MNSLPMAKRTMFLAMLIALVFTVSVNAQEDKGGAMRKPLQGKVSSLLKRTKRAVVSGRKRDFRRLIQDDAQHDKLMAKFSEPMDEDARKDLYQKRMARYGASRIHNQVALSDFGQEVLVEKKKRPAKKSAKEPADDSGFGPALIIFAIFAGSMYVIRRNSM